jgi:hypothetical protein
MKISVIGLFRNSAQHINNTLSSLDRLSELGIFDFYFYENDSKDDTNHVLQCWLEDKKGFLTSENIQAPQFGSVTNIERLVLLSYYRNKVKESIKNTTSDFSLLIDTDILFDNNHFLSLFEHLKNNEQTAMVVANTRQYQIEDLMYYETADSFYDVFAFRDIFNNNGLYFTDCPFVLNNDRHKWKDNQPIEIHSGFGGFALVRTDILKRSECLWSTCGHSEHVNFCSSVSKHGKIMMLPNCKPRTEIDLSSINIEACKNIAKKQINTVLDVNHIYDLSTSKTLNLINKS